MTKFSVSGFGILGCVFGIASLAYALYQDHKHSELEKDVRDKIGMSMDSIAKKTTIDVQESIVNSTVERIAVKKVNEVANDAIASLKADMRNDITKKVKKEVEAQYSALTEEVSEKIAEQVEAISDEALSNKVLPRVEEKLLRKGESMLQKVRDESVRELGKSIELVKSVKDVVNTFSGGNGGATQNNGNGRVIMF